MKVTITSNAALKDIDRVDTLEIRSLRKLGSSWHEIGNADCTLRGRGIQANFKTPAQIEVPVYRGRTQEVRVQCRAPVDGVSRVSGKTIKAINRTAERIDEGITFSVGTGGPHIGGTLSIRDRDKDVFDYTRRADIVFR